MTKREYGGVSESDLLGMARRANGLWNGKYLILNPGHLDQRVIAPERMGISATPDPLGTVTIKSRPYSLREALQKLDQTSKNIRSG